MDGGNSISRRTRSHWDAFYRSCHDKIKKKKPADDNGNSRNNFENKDNEYDDSVSIEGSDNSSMAAEDCESSSDDADEDYKQKYLNKRGPRKVGTPTKKKACGVIEGFDFINMMLADSRSKEEEDLGCSVLVEENDVSECITQLLPLKFRFEDDDDDLEKRTDWEIEIDSLFCDLEMGLCDSEAAAAAAAAGCLNSPMTDDDECSNSTDIDETPLARCRLGKHDHFLDEQMGIMCRYCCAVLLDIKYVLPPFLVETPERRERKEMEEPIMNQVQFQDSNCCNLQSSVHSTGTVFDLIPNSEKAMYSHQLDGFEFLWRNIAGDIHINQLRKLPANTGRGCIISHAPGTGKTRLTIVFLQTFVKLYPTCRPVIIAPRGMLLTWEQEFKKWKVRINFHNLNETKLSDQENEVAASIADQTGGHQRNKDYIRFIKLLSWMKGGSILGVGYRLFEKLAGEHDKKCNDKFKKILLESPGLLILDEGHTPRNNQSLTWKALTDMTTQRRVILSGTPFQNNFSELYNTLSLVNPRSYPPNVGKRRGRKRKVDILKDEWANLTNSITSNDDGLKKLRSMIEPFVHVHKGDILQKTLPGMRDCLIILKPTDFQRKLLENNADQVDQYLEQAYFASLISVHPSLVAEKTEFNAHKRKLKSLESDPNAGVKTHFLVKLIQLSSRLREKVLVFSEFIDPLLHIKNMLKSHFSWKEGKEVMYMDGELCIQQRQRLINLFNSKCGEAKVMLASQKACCEGINLVGASRVVLLDVAWNPSVERQAICRAYRIGQEKMVYVYHLVTMMEVKKYARQAEKERISELIFCEGVGGKRRKCSAGNDEGVLEDEVLEEMLGDRSFGGVFERIIHRPKESDLVNTFGFVDLN